MKVIGTDRNSEYAKRGDQWHVRSTTERGVKRAWVPLGYDPSEGMSDFEWVTSPPSDDGTTNPKDAMGSAKPPLSCASMPVFMEIGTAMAEGARKYGRHNWRATKIRYSVYFDAAIRHLFAWWEGEDIDAESNASHITKTLTCLMVLRDAMLFGTVVDDRPPVMQREWMAECKKTLTEIVEKYPDALPPHTRLTALGELSDPEPGLTALGEIG